jgi:hypothetical protein
MSRIDPVDLGTENIAIAAARSVKRGSAHNGVGLMRKGFLSSLAVLLAGTGLSFGQPGPEGIPGPGGVPDPGFATPQGRPIIAPPGYEGAIPPYAMPQGSNPVGGPEDGGGRRGIFGGGNPGGPPRFWMGFDYLLWQPKSMPAPGPVITTSAPGSEGILGAPSTQSLFGGDKISFGSANGFRTWLGWSLDEENRLSFELSGFLLESRSDSFGINSSPDGIPLLSVPFLNNDTGAQNSYIVAFPTLFSGGVSVEAKTKAWGAEGNYFLNLYRGGGEEGAGGTSFDVLYGFRFMELEERFTMQTVSTSLDPSVIIPFSGVGVAGSPTVATYDRYRTFNDFYGANLGFRSETNYGRLYLGLVGKFGFGYMRSRAEIEGGSSISGGGTSSAAVMPGGLFTTGDILGTHRKDTFAILPEGAINVGYNITPRIRAQVGYTFLWVNKVLRPTPLVSQGVNPTLVPTNASFGGAPTNYVPVDTGRYSEFWLQGVNFGLQMSF